MFTRAHTILTAAATLAMTAVLSSPAKACTPPLQPSPDCTQPFNCCVSGALDIDDNTNFGGQWVCGDVALFSIIANQCGATAFASHNQTFHVVTDTYQDHGLGQCDGELEYAKHWSAAFLIGTTIEYVQDQTWHHPIQDYLATAQARSNHIHPGLEHRLQVTKPLAMPPDPNASYHFDLFQDDTISFFCPLFNANQTGTPAYRASDFIHEAWHSVYLLHDQKLPNNGGDRDWFHAHDHVLWPGHITDCFEPSFKPAGWAGRADCAGDTRTSVYQLQYEFLCDMVTHPQQWVPRSIVTQAALLTNWLDTTRFSGQTVFRNPPPYTCNVIPPARDTRGLSVPGHPRLVELRVDGHLFEGSVGGYDNDELDIEHVFELIVSSDSPTAGASWTSPVADEVWVEVKLIATLLADGESVDVKYNVFFFEHDEDQTHCDADLTGYDCPAQNDSNLWPIISLTSDNPLGWAPPPKVEHLDNLGNENGDDTADLSLSFELDW